MLSPKPLDVDFDYLIDLNTVDLNTVDPNMFLQYCKELEESVQELSNTIETRRKRKEEQRKHKKKD